MIIQHSMAVLQVLMFGGGLSVEWLKGTVCNNDAWMAVAVVARSTFTADNASFERNNMLGGTIYGGCSSGSCCQTVHHLASFKTKPISSAQSSSRVQRLCALLFV
jgi:hypothetical protein